MKKRNGYDKILNDLNIDKNTFFKIGFNNIIGLNDNLYKEKVIEISNLIISSKEETYYRENNGILKYHYDNIRNEIFYKRKCIASSDSRYIVQLVIKCLNEKGINYNNIKKEYLQDYDLSHIWDATQNPLLYTLPWNYYFIPKIISPITDRNVRYDKDRKFLKEIMKSVIKNYKNEINQYNEFMEKNKNKIIKYYREKILTDEKINSNQQLLNSFKSQFFLIDTKNEDSDNLYRVYIIK